VTSVTCGAEGTLGPAYTGAPVSLVFQDKGSRSCSGGNMELQVPVCAGKQDLLPSECQVMEPGVLWGLQGKGFRSIELRVVLPIFPVISCFLLVMGPRGCLLGSSDLPSSG
jgi:hypothetical protein